MERNLMLGASDFNKPSPERPYYVHSHGSWAAGLFDPTKHEWPIVEPGSTLFVPDPTQPWPSSASLVLQLAIQLPRDQIELNVAPEIAA